MSGELLARSELVLDDCDGHLYRLSQTAGFIIPKIVHLNKPQITFGRAPHPENDITLDSKKVQLMISRKHHAKIIKDGSDWKIVDNNSKNGVFVNKKRVMEAVLKDDDVIVFGGGYGVALELEKPIQWDSDFLFVYKSREAAENLVLPTVSDVEVPSSKKARLVPRTRISQAEEEQRQAELKQTTERLAELEKKLLETQKAEGEKLQAELQAQREGWKAELAEKEALLQEQMAAKEERMQAEMRAWAEEAKAKSIKDSEMQKQLSEENTRLQSTLESEMKKTLSTEKMKETLEQELKKTKQDLGTAEQRLVKKSELEEEITCPICQDVFVKTMTLECSHSFCSECLIDYFARSPNRTCPVCRAKVAKDPVPSITVDNVVDRMMTKETPEERKRLEERRQLAKLKEMASQAKARNMHFLTISAPWSVQNRRVFSDGVKRYQGKARVQYCALTGLTSSWIEGASADKLRAALDNLTLPSNNDDSTVMLRKRLTDFIFAAQ